MLKKLETLITKIEPPNWVLVILSFVFLLRIPSLFEPYYYGDEMIYLTLGNAIRRGLTLYSQIHDNKPPLLYIVAAIAGNLFWFKAILMFWMFVTIVAFWHLTKILFEKNINAQKVSVTIFAILTTIPFLEGNIINAELFFIGPIILAMVLLLKNGNTKNLILGGILFSIGALFKIPVIFDIPVIIIYWLITLKDLNIENLFKIFKKTLVIAIAFVIPILLTFFWYFAKGALNDYLKAAFLQNLGYISSWNGGAQTSFLVKHSSLLIRAAVVIVGLIILRIKSKNLSKPFLVACIWLLTSLFAVTLSERPYPHYFIEAVPAVSLLIGILVASPKIDQVLAIIPLTLAVFVPVYYKFYYYPTYSYYANFTKFVTRQESKSEYFNNISQGTEVNYEVANFIMTSTKQADKIFVWGNDAPTIYALSKRLPPIKYVANYHITDFSTTADVAKSLENTPPVLIIKLPNSPQYKELDLLLTKRYVLISNNNNSQIWHLWN